MDDTKTPLTNLLSIIQATAVLTSIGIGAVIGILTALDVEIPLPPKPEPPTIQTQTNPTTTPVNDLPETISEWAFPMDRCGDPPPSNASEQHPAHRYRILIHGAKDNLEIAQKSLCADAYPRGGTRQGYIQVASFNDMERANEFKNQIMDEFDNFKKIEIEQYLYEGPK